ELFAAAASERKQDLRARIGVAWATAAIDCRKARPLLRDLEPIAEAHPEVWLVDGQCAPAPGDRPGARAPGRPHPDRSPASPRDAARPGGAGAFDRAPAAAASGHALVGEAFAARGNLADARKELETARTLEPSRRRWTVRLAVVLRRGSHAADALAALDE